MLHCDAVNQGSANSRVRDDLKTPALSDVTRCHGGAYATMLQNAVVLRKVVNFVSQHMIKFQSPRLAAYEYRF